MSEFYDQYLALSKEERRRLYQLENDNSFDVTEDISCPYCNETLGLENEDAPYNEESLEYTCYNCNNKFDVTSHVSYSWSTQIPSEQAMEMLKAEQESKMCTVCSGSGIGSSGDSESRCFACEGTGEAKNV